MSVSTPFFMMGDLLCQGSRTIGDTRIYASSLPAKVPTHRKERYLATLPFSGGVIQRFKLKHDPKFASNILDRSRRREAAGGHYDLNQCAPELIDLVMTGAAGRPSPVYLQTKRPLRCGLLFYLSQSSSFGGPLMGRNAKKGEPVFTKRLCSCSN